MTDQPTTPTAEEIAAKFAPDKMPTIKPEDGDSPFLKEWVAAITSDRAYAVCIRDDSLLAGGEASMVAVCPAPEYAQYLAHMHNMLLAGSKMFDTDIAGMLEGYATNTNPKPARPAETGGYL